MSCVHYRPLAKDRKRAAHIAGVPHRQPACQPVLSNHRPRFHQSHDLLPRGSLIFIARISSSLHPSRFSSACTNRSASASSCARSGAGPELRAFPGSLRQPTSSDCRLRRHPGHRKLALINRRAVDLRPRFSSNMPARASRPPPCAPVATSSSSATPQATPKPQVLSPSLRLKTVRLCSQAFVGLARLTTFLGIPLDSAFVLPRLAGCLAAISRASFSDESGDMKWHRAATARSDA